MQIRPKFPTELKYWKYEIERIGRRLGLKFSQTIYEMVTSEEMSEIVAYHGYPVRYHHWSHGQESLKLKKLTTRFGLMTFFELIIPTLPCYAYLLATNTLAAQKMVMAHAGLGHNDFFEHNAWFRAVPRNLHTSFGAHAETIDRFRAEFGRDRVDAFLETCLSLDNCIDILGSAIARLPKRDRKSERTRKSRRQPQRIPRKEELPSYMEDVLNPPEWLEKQRKKIEEEEQREVDIRRGLILPEAPVRDVLGFLIEHSSLEPWQREILRIVRDESYAMYVGTQTKIMNEGWAAYWESEVMAGEGVAIDSEVGPFARNHAGVLRQKPAGINPYRLGFELWDDLAFRWNTGRHGSIFEDCHEAGILNRWDEFVVYKNLCDRYGASTPAFTEAWALFCTLIHETDEGRGAYPAAFFNSRQWILEWRALERAEGEQDLFRSHLTKVALAEQEIAERLESGGLSTDDPKRFKFRFDIAKHNDMDPDLDWTLEEVEQQLRRIEILLSFRERFREGKCPKVINPIPQFWHAWSERYPGAVEVGKGREKMFEVRETHNDTAFIQDFFTPEFCEKRGYFTIATRQVFDEHTWEEVDVYVVRSRAFQRVKTALLLMINNLGQPKIEIVNANLENNRELLLQHLHDGRDLNADDIPEILRRLWLVWGRKKRVHLDTIETEYPKRKPYWWYWRPQGVPLPPPELPILHSVRYTFNGRTFEKKEMGTAVAPRPLLFLF